LSAPLILGNNLEQLDDFTKSLLTNDEVLDVDQDSLGKQATMVRQEGETRVYAKPLADGSWAVGLFNLGPEATNVTMSWVDLRIRGKQAVRDLWRQKDLGIYHDQFASPVPAHGVRLVRIVRSK
jgi:alpha-galactosidase